MNTILLAAAALLATAACAPTASQAAAAGAPTGGDCFRNRDVDTYRVIDPHTLRVINSHDRAYDLTTAEGRLQDADSGLHIGLHSRSSWICTGNGLDTEIVAPREPNRSWHVDTVTRVPADVLNPPPAQPSQH